ncbi:MAG: hypothetical protein P1V20_00450 [Verrucomicrobiales bacterium]|nr:hypothetical protein [Verrucomicrobiales bacterium]
MKDDIEYRKKRLVDLKKETDELKKEIAEYDALIGDSNESPDVSEKPKMSYGDLLKKAASLEKRLNGKVVLLDKMKGRFIDRIPLKKGDALGTFTTTDGKNLADVVVTEVDAPNVVVVHSKGTSRLGADDFPDSISASWNKRPELETLESLEQVYSHRPGNVLKSAAFAGRRKELAKERAEMRSSSRPVAQAETSGSSTNVRAEREAEMNQRVAAIVEFNRDIDAQLTRKEAELTSKKAALASLEMQFMKDTMEYDIVRIRRGRGASQKEAERRLAIVTNYEKSKEELSSSISDLEREIFTLVSKRKFNPNMSGSGGLTYDQLKKRAAELRDEIKSMNKDLDALYDELYSLQDVREESLREYDNSTIKPDRQAYERKMNKMDTQIIQKMIEINKLVKEIDELRITIPRL